MFATPRLLFHAIKGVSLTVDKMMAMQKRGLGRISAGSYGERWEWLDNQIKALPLHELEKVYLEITTK